MNFLTADDMSAILAVKLRKRLGFGMWAKLNITGMHIEGKVLVGVKFMQTWPFISRLRVCFVEPPYFQMTVKPIFTHGLDVTDIPGIAGWLDKLLSIAFEQTLVEPNMLVVDVEKFVSPQPESWFSVDEKDPVAYAKIVVVEASDMKPSDLNGLADPYVKGRLGGYRFKTKIQKKTLSPKWQEEFKIPILTWESSNMLVIEVRDKDHFYDDNLGDCSVNINDLRDGQSHDMWLPLQNVKMGRLHLAITILDNNEKVVDNICGQETADIEERKDSYANETTNKSSFSSASSDKSPKMADNYEPVDVDGQKETGIWVHHPGSEVCKTWEPRKGKSRRLDTEIRGEPNDLDGNRNSTASGPLNNDSSSPDDNTEDKHLRRSFRRGLHNISSVFRRSKKRDDKSDPISEEFSSPRVNIRSVNEKGVGVQFIMEDHISGFPTGKIQVEGGSTEGSGPDSPAKGNVKDMAKNILKHAEKSARSLKHAISRKSGKYKGELPTAPEGENESDSTDDESLSAQSPIDERTTIASQATVSGNNGSPNSRVNVVQSVPSNTAVEGEAPVENTKLEVVPEKASSPDRSGEEFIKSDQLERDKEEIVADK